MFSFNTAPNAARGAAFSQYTEQDTLKNLFSAIVPNLREIPCWYLEPNEPRVLNKLPGVRKLTILNIGWHVPIFPTVLVETERKFRVTTDGPAIDRFVLRIAKYDFESLLPNQVTNDVAFRRFVAQRLPHIPVPRVYCYNATDKSETSWVVEEYIDAKPLLYEWMNLSQAQKESMSETIANIVVDFAEVQFDKIGGLNPTDLSSAPNVEYNKIFEGRREFHDRGCYNIGPYNSMKEYILACYDREIYYYTHDTDEDIAVRNGAFADQQDDEEYEPKQDPFGFYRLTVPELVERLHHDRANFMKSEVEEEPLVLVHPGLSGCNILVRYGKIAGILHWETAGSYPLSLTFERGPIRVAYNLTRDGPSENEIWSRRVGQRVREQAAKRGWDQDRIDTLMGERKIFELGLARSSCRLVMKN
ncbi:kinase-like domain-containing protein [Hypoxylon trugodes]|uniref:kinase-like domain-containing protein n=1 Tax=Hypoxylon trugodes TaxID=326681 RepID=UPI002199E069|nr:kinase-like domain-containing protein [Hypoxylon trugodes]KAI1392947.1 kinase-like domain-containing protein [Hypoxylon trugodes]